MRLVKVSAKHFINADLMIEVYSHLAERGLTIVMAARMLFLIMGIFSFCLFISRWTSPTSEA